MSFITEFSTPAKCLVANQHTAPKSTESSSKQVVSPLTPHDPSLQRTRDESSDSRWCTDRTAQRPSPFEMLGKSRRAAGVGVGIKLYAKLAAFGLAASLLCAGCGTGMTVMAMMSPSISQVSPQVVTAGTPSVTVTVQGTNFQSQAALTVNGDAVPTTVVNSTTIAANISGTKLAQPAVAQLQVRNSNGGQSNQVPLTVTNALQSPSALSITTTQLPSVQVGTPYKVTLAAAGG